jgi:hypothetical protein
VPSRSRATTMVRRWPGWRQTPRSSATALRCSGRMSSLTPQSDLACQIFARYLPDDALFAQLHKLMSFIFPSSLPWSVYRICICFLRTCAFAFTFLRTHSTTTRAHPTATTLFFFSPLKSRPGQDAGKEGQEG